MEKPTHRDLAHLVRFNIYWTMKISIYCHNAEKIDISTKKAWSRHCQRYRFWTVSILELSDILDLMHSSRKITPPSGHVWEVPVISRYMLGKLVMRSHELTYCALNLSMYHLTSHQNKDIIRSSPTKKPSWWFQPIEKYSSNRIISPSRFFFFF